MDFSLTDEHRMAQKMVRDFTHKEIIPIIQEWDRKQDMAPFVLPRKAELGILWTNIDEYPVERYLQNSKGAVIYEGTNEIHQLLQANYALGHRDDRPLQCEFPAYDADYWRKK